MPPIHSSECDCFPRILLIFCSFFPSKRSISSWGDSWIWDRMAPINFEESHKAKPTSIKPPNYSSILTGDAWIKMNGGEACIIQQLFRFTKITSELTPSSKAEACCVFTARLNFRDKRQDVTTEKSKGLGPPALLLTRLMILSKSFNPLDFVLSFYYSSLQQTRRRQWHPIAVLVPGKSHGWSSLAGYSPGGRKESDTTERLHFHFSLSCTGEGNGNPLQCSCLENPRDGRS